jgi:hypothetical protein
MNRCKDCNSVLLKTETTCESCGAVVAEPKRGLGSHFTVLVSVALYVSLAMTAAALFLPGMPPLSKCLPVCLVLLMIRSSADQMTDSGK